MSLFNQYRFFHYSEIHAFPKDKKAYGVQNDPIKIVSILEQVEKGHRQPLKPMQFCNQSTNEIKIILIRF